LSPSRAVARPDGEHIGAGCGRKLSRVRVIIVRGILRGRMALAAARQGWWELASAGVLAGQAVCGLVGECLRVSWHARGLGFESP
jgi:hypothetical protein